MIRDNELWTYYFEALKLQFLCDYLLILVIAFEIKCMSEWLILDWLVDFFLENSEFEVSEFAGGSSEQNQEDAYSFINVVLHFLFIWYLVKNSWYVFSNYISSTMNLVISNPWLAINESI